MVIPTGDPEHATSVGGSLACTRPWRSTPRRSFPLSSDFFSCAPTTCR